MKEQINVLITDQNGQSIKGYISSEEVYDALSKILRFTEIRPNIWADNDGNRYILTRLGFIKYRDTLKTVQRYS